MLWHVYLPLDPLILIYGNCSIHVDFLFDALSYGSLLLVLSKNSTRKAAHIIHSKLLYFYDSYGPVGILYCIFYFISNTRYVYIVMLMCTGSKLPLYPT